MNSPISQSVSPSVTPRSPYPSREVAKIVLFHIDMILRAQEELMTMEKMPNAQESLSHELVRSKIESLREAIQAIQGDHTLLHSTLTDLKIRFPEMDLTISRLQNFAVVI